MRNETKTVTDRETNKLGRHFLLTGDKTALTPLEFSLADRVESMVKPPHRDHKDRRRSRPRP